VATIAQVELIGSDAAYALGPYTATLGPDNRRLGIPVMADRHSI
jgi:hypothetical protein